MLFCKKIKGIRKGFLLFLLSNVFITCFSQNRLDSMQFIDEIVVMARTSREVIPTQKLQGPQLERLNSQSVADALRYFSGVQIKDYGGIGGLKTINIRSMGTNHLGVFYDGIQLGNAQNGQIDLGKFSLDNMEELALYNGQRSNIFQSARDFASSGALYLSTSKPRFRNNEKAHLKASFRTGAYEMTNPALSLGLLNPSFKWDQKLSSSVNSSISAEWLHSDGRYKTVMKKVDSQDHSVSYDSTIVRENGDIDSWRIEGSLNGTIKNGEWDARLYYYTSERGLPGAVVENRYVNWGDRLWDKNFFFQSSFNKKISSRYEIQAKTKYAYDNTHYLHDDTIHLNSGEYLDRIIDNTYKQQEFYISEVNKYSILPCWNVVLATDFIWNKLDSDTSGFASPQRYTGLVALATDLQSEKFRLQANLLATFVKESVKTGPAPSNKNIWTPTIIAFYQPFDEYDFSLRAFYKKIFRMPTFNDLYYKDIGSSNLKPEYTTQYNLGLTYNKNFRNSIFNRIGIQTDCYYNQVKDKIIASPTGSQFFWMMENLGLVKIHGVDVGLQISTTLPEQILLDLRVNYTYQKARDYSDPTSPFYKDQIPYIPEHSGSFVLNGTYKSWELNYSFIYTGERYDSKANIPENHLQPWYTSDVSASKNFKLNSFQFKISAEVNNLFNQYYDVVINYPMPGRNYRLGVSLNI